MLRPRLCFTALKRRLRCLWRGKTHVSYARLVVQDEMGYPTSPRDRGFEVGVSLMSPTGQPDARNVSPAQETVLLAYQRCP